MNSALLVIDMQRALRTGEEAAAGIARCRASFGPRVDDVPAAAVALR